MQKYFTFFVKCYIFVHIFAGMKANPITIKLENLIIRHGVTFTFVASQMGLQYRGFRKKLLAPKSFKVDEIERLAEILGCPVVDVVKCVMKL